MSENVASNVPDPDQLVEQLAPRLRELDQEREQMRRAALRHSGFIAAAAAIGALFVALLIGIGSPDSGIAIFVLVGGAVWIGFLLARRHRKWRERAQGELVPAVCAQFDKNLDYRPTVDSRSWIKPFEALGLIGSWNSGGAAHYMGGQYRGLRFEMVHASLYSRSGGKNSSSVPVFYGLLCRIQAPWNVDPGISIVPNFGWYSKMFGKQNIPLGNPEFDRTFLVTIQDGQSGDKAAVAPVLSPSLQQALLGINESEGKLAFDRPVLSAGLKYDSLYLAMTLEEEGRSIGPVKVERRRPFLEVGHLLATQSKLEPGVRAMVRDIGTIYRIIDRLQPVLEDSGR